MAKSNLLNTSDLTLKGLLGNGLNYRVPTYQRDWCFDMSSATQELIASVDGLPEDKAREVVDFARFLQEVSGDAEWERIIADRRSYTKLEQFAAESLREGAAVDPCPASARFSL